MNTLPNFVNTLDYQKGAEDALRSSNQEKVFRYIQGTSGHGISYARNRQHFDNITLLPSVLSGSLSPNLETSLIGQKLKTPLMLCPIAYQKLVHQEGELASVQAAMAQDIGFCLSTLSTYNLEHVSQAASTIGLNAPLWFQLYIQPQKTINQSLIKRAEDAGYQAIVITVDAPINGLRYHEARDKFAVPDDNFTSNLAPYSSKAQQGLCTSLNDLASLMSNAPSWRDVEEIISWTHLPVVLKGILTPADAIKAKEIGAQAVIVSNHGGRVLDCVPSAISALPLIRQAIGPSFPILFDSGVRSGSDIYKALALGANAVMIGRPFLHALTVAGALGVAHVLRLLKDELLVTMSLMGNETINSIDQSKILNAHAPLS